ncbi:uncharacterized protein LOC143288740 [Babylonia areolata]|uniref:uncharacterized protein LOC143288740 n=1 Tax=Babylonia areolata TaxID=304850 RepID=UPI003FD236D4
MEENETKEKAGSQQEKEEKEEKPRWIDLFERESHRRHQTEYMRDMEYEDIITTLRRGFSQEAGGDDRSNSNSNSNSSGVSPYHIPLVPAETYFLTPDPHHHDHSLTGGGGGGKHSRSSRSYSSSQSVSSFGASTITTSAPASSRKCLPPEVAEEKRKSRRRRTAAYVCLGVLGLALVALAVGVILHFLLESGSIGGGKEKADSRAHQ